MLKKFRISIKNDIGSLKGSVVLVATNYKAAAKNYIEHIHCSNSEIEFIVNSINSLNHFKYKYNSLEEVILDDSNGFVDLDEYYKTLFPLKLFKLLPFADIYIKKSAIFKKSEPLIAEVKNEILKGKIINEILVNNKPHIKEFICKNFAQLTNISASELDFSNQIVNDGIDKAVGDFVLILQDKLYNHSNLPKIVKSEKKTKVIDKLLISKKKKWSDI
jgi:hypothetical protein